MDITLPDGKRALATVRTLEEPLGQIAVFQRTHRCARLLALRYRADRHPLRHHRLRPADPRLRLPLAGDARARGRPDLRHRAQPHRYRAQSRPLRLVGLGPRARTHLLVAFDVRDPGPRCARRPADLRRDQQARASRRHRSLSSWRPRSPMPSSMRSITTSACCMRAAAGCGCACAARWCASRTSPACI